MKRNGPKHGLAAAVWDERRRKDAPMGKRMIFIAGMGVGYVLGARAGRERFDQMVAMTRKFWESPTVQEAAGVVQAQAGRLYDGGKHVVSNQVHRVTSRNGSAVKEPDDNKDEAWDTAVRRSGFPSNSF
jgi:hypothetical protein